MNTLGGNIALGNGASGVNIQSNGAVTVTGLETIFNGLDGLDVRNGYLGTNPPGHFEFDHQPGQRSTRHLRGFEWHRHDQ